MWTVKQREFWRGCGHRWNVKEGATRSGKTYLDYFLIPRRIRELAGREGLVVLLGNTRGTLQRNIIRPMQEIWSPALVSDIRGDNTALLFGERCYCLGADKISQVDRLRGSSIKYCYGDEVATWSPEVFDILKSRLDRAYSKFDGTCNPEGPTHWFYEFLENKAGVDLFRQSYALEDNPTLDASFVENLKREYAGTVYYDRYILGKWARAEGLIYDTFKPECKRSAPASFDRVWAACDYGTQNATAFLLIGQQGASLYVIKEYYYSGRDAKRQKTDSQYADDMQAFLRGFRIEAVVVDPSAASFIAELRLRSVPVQKADNSVLDGIRRVSSQFALGRLFVDPGCENLLRELGSYSWDKKSAVEQPLKEDDHACDALRYGVAYSMRSAFVRF